MNLIHWLNDDNNLSRKVSCLEKDLSNVFLVGELLHQAGLEKRFNKYCDDNHMSFKLQNMEFLSDTLQKLGVDIPIDLRRSVMMEDKSSVIKLLNEVKCIMDSRAQLRTILPKDCESMHTKKQLKKCNNQENGVDVESRFIAETASSFVPDSVRYLKDLSMSIHLRDFQKRSLTSDQKNSEKTRLMESDLNVRSHEHRCEMKHLQEKKKFLEQWDRDHQEAWEETQVLHMHTEKKDLRLEITHQERKWLQKEKSSKCASRDSSDGIATFEKNFNRLGLGDDPSTQSKSNFSQHKICSPCVSGLEHLHHLERKVQELDYRASNNVKMMKELRERRRIQLAAEKDRMFRQKKILASRKKVISEGELEDIRPVSKKIRTFSPIAEKSDSDSEEETSKGFHNEYFENYHNHLKEHFTRLRIIGSTHRELERNKLTVINQEKAKIKASSIHKFGHSIVMDLINLAIGIASRGERDDIANKPSQSLLHYDEIICRQHKEIELEVQQAVRHLLSCGGTDYDIVTKQISSFATQILSTDPKPFSWSLPYNFPIISLLTSDRKQALVHRLADEHSLYHLHVDDIVDECVRCAELPKQEATNREVELATAGRKIIAIKAKGGFIPDSLLIELVTGSIIHCLKLRDEQKSSLKGILLHNFPRTVEEEKLLEKAVALVSNQQSKSNIQPGTNSDLLCLNACIIINETNSSKLNDEESPTSDKVKCYKSEQLEALRAVFIERSACLTINSRELSDVSLLEYCHLFIEGVTTKEIDQAAVLECSAAHVPDNLLQRREARRASLDIFERIDLMRSAGELMLNDENLICIIAHLDAIQTDLMRELQKRLQFKFKLLENVSNYLWKAFEKLQAIFDRNTDEEECLNQYTQKLSLLELEVRLGDIVEKKRKVASESINQWASDDFFEEIKSMELEWAFGICQTLVYYTMERLMVYSTLFSNISFMQENTEEIDAEEKALNVFYNDLSEIRKCKNMKDLTDQILLLIEPLSVYQHSNKSHNTNIANIQRSTAVRIEISNTIRQIENFLESCIKMNDMLHRIRDSDLTQLRDFVSNMVKTSAKEIEATVNEFRKSWKVCISTQRQSSAYFIGSPSNIKCYNPFARDAIYSFLSFEDIRRIIAALKEEEKIEKDGLLTVERFICCMLRLADTEELNGIWRSREALLSLCKFFSSLSGKVFWRKLFFSIVAVQYCGVPTLEQIDQYLRDVQKYCVEENLKVFITYHEFMMIPMWFEANMRESLSCESKNILYNIFATEEDGVYLGPMLLYWSCYPVTPNGIRNDFGCLVPQYPRGLYRAFYSLIRYGGEEPGNLSLEFVFMLISFCNIEIDEDKCEELLNNRSCWLNSEYEEFLKFCDAYDRFLPQHFIFYNPFSIEHSKN